MEHHERRSGELARELLNRVAERPDPYAELLGGASADRAFDERQSRRWQHQVDEESATWEGTLLDLAERGTQVALDTTRGGRVVGHLTGVGTDVVVLSRGNAPDLWLRRASIVSLSLLERTLVSSGSREAKSVTLQALIFSAAAFRPAISMVLTGQIAVINGVLMSCGVDVCLVRTDSEVRRNIVVHLAAVDEVTVHG